MRGAVRPACHSASRKRLGPTQCGHPHWCRLSSVAAYQPHTCAPLSPPDADLDTKCERLLRRRFSLPLDFTAEQAIPALCKWGLVACLPDGRLHAQPLPAALTALDAVWDGIYDFPAVRDVASSAGNEAAGPVAADSHAAGRAALGGQDGTEDCTLGSGGEAAQGAGAEWAEGPAEDDAWQLAAVGGEEQLDDQPEQLEVQQQEQVGAWEAGADAGGLASGAGEFSAGQSSGLPHQKEHWLEPGSWTGPASMGEAELEGGLAAAGMIEANAALEGGLGVEEALRSGGWSDDADGAAGAAEVLAAAEQAVMNEVPAETVPAAEGQEQGQAEAWHSGGGAVPAGLPQAEAGLAGAACEAGGLPISEESSLSLSSASSSSSLEFVSLRKAAAWRSPGRCRNAAAPAAAADPSCSPARSGSCAAVNVSPCKRSPSARLSPQQLRRLGLRRQR